MDEQLHGGSKDRKNTQQVQRSHIFDLSLRHLIMYYSPPKLQGWRRQTSELSRVRTFHSNWCLPQNKTQFARQQRLSTRKWPCMKSWCIFTYYVVIHGCLHRWYLLGWMIWLMLDIKASSTSCTRNKDRQVRQEGSWGTRHFCFVNFCDPSWRLYCSVFLFCCGLNCK